MTRAAARWLVGAIGALLAAWMLAPAVVPIYDGIGNPDEPYRYVTAPPGAKTTKPPTPAQVTISVRNGVSVNGYANSAEVGPQVSIYFPTGALEVPSGTTSIVVTATPEAPSPPLPTDGTIVTNVYRVAATAAGKNVRVIGTGHAAPTLQMRAPNGKGSPVFEHRTANGWEKSQTARVGFDIYQTSVPALGDWALVQPKGVASSSTGGGGGGGVNVGLLAGGIAILLLAGVVFLVRSTRSRRAAA